MPFNEQIAREAARRDDRDVARWFAGRTEECRFVEDAITDAPGRGGPALFRIFQGPPGAGKSSLLRHIRGLYAERADIVFIEPHNDTLASLGELRMKIVEEAMARRAFDGGAPGLAGYIASVAGQTLAEYLRGTTVSQAIGALHGKSATDGLTAILMVDEAQQLNDDHKATINDLHKIGTGIPTVFIAGGLSYTERVFNGFGVSRTAHNAIHDLGELSADECVESTMMMLKEIAPCGTKCEYREAARLTAELAFGWPQHLCRSQQALAAEICRTRGDLAGIERDHIEVQTKKARDAYYSGRVVASPTLADCRVAVYNVIREVAEQSPLAPDGLFRLCKSALGDEEHAMLEEGDARVMADEMVQLGVVVEQPDERFAVPIPSMVDWATERLQARHLPA